MKFKLPEGCGDRKGSIESLLKKDREVSESILSEVKQAAIDFLRVAKGYGTDELEIDQEFDVTIGTKSARSKAHIVVNINGKRLIAVKCSADSVVSRERHALACARLLESYQIPLAVITDGMDAVVLDTVTGETIGEGLESIPSRQGLEVLAEQIEFKELQPKRVDKEKRIVCAFDAIGYSRL